MYEKQAPYFLDIPKVTISTISTTKGLGGKAEKVKFSGRPVIEYFIVNLQDANDNLQTSTYVDQGVAFDVEEIR
ncbi:MAG: hypothetical protein H6765_08450 [Candidatus Peribacteria bacterium]|nr:MAG: hypothetical protein H6765_08450 [Candidatus Peribacteria bacterium]